MVHVMHDLETFGNTPGSALRSLGAIVFDPVTGQLGDSFYANISRASCERIGLTVDPKTEAWWAEQSPEAQAALEPDQQDITDVLEHFSLWYAFHDGSRLWCQGPSYDASLLEAAYRAAGLRTPWNYNAPRDTRTIYDAGGITPDRERGSLHDALEDARAQALDVAAGWARMVGSPQLHLPEAIRALPIDRLREEVWAWRQDAAARIRGMMASAKASDQRGEEERAIDLRVNFIRPSAAALTQYLAGEFHEGCEACGEPLLNGQQVWPVEDANDVHVRCWPGPIIQDGAAVTPYTYSDLYTPPAIAAVAVEALAYCDGDLDTPDTEQEA